MNKNGKIAVGVIGGLAVLGAVTQLVNGQNKPAAPAAETTTAIVTTVTTTTAATTTTASQTTAATTTTEKPLTVYLLNPDSMKIHYEYCPTIEHPENFEKTIDYEKAISDGYTPCGRCNPVNHNKYE